MNKLKLISFSVFVLLIFACEKSFSQTQNNQDQQTQQTDPSTDTQSTTEPVPTDPNTVTIDSTATESYPSSPPPAENSGNTQSTQKIHLYSGKHDGNNVINPDPKNQ